MPWDLPLAPQGTASLHVIDANSCGCPWGIKQWLITPQMLIIAKGMPSPPGILSTGSSLKQFDMIKIVSRMTFTVNQNSSPILTAIFQEENMLLWLGF